MENDMSPDVFQVVVRTDGTGVPQILSLRDETGTAPEDVILFGNAMELSAATNWIATDTLQIMAVIQRWPDGQGWIVASADEFHDSRSNEALGTESFTGSPEEVARVIIGWAEGERE